MTTPGNYPYAQLQALWGGVQTDVQQGTVAADAAALMAAQGQAEDGENGRRELAAGRPGHGTPLYLPQPPAGSGVGIADVELPVVGMGYDVGPESSPAQVASYVVPNYAPDVVGGYGFAGGRQEAPARRHVSQTDDGVLLAEPGPDGRQFAPGMTVVSPALGSRRGRLGRLLGRLRGRR